MTSARTGDSTCARSVVGIGAPVAFIGAASPNVLPGATMISLQASAIIVPAEKAWGRIQASVFCGALFLIS